MNWFGLEYQDCVPYTVRAAGIYPGWPEGGVDTAVSARMTYRKGSLVEALALSQPWQKMIVGIPLRRCAEAEQICLLDPPCAAIVNSVVDPMYPTVVETARCGLNTLCARGLAACVRLHPLVDASSFYSNLLPRCFSADQWDVNVMRHADPLLGNHRWRSAILCSDNLSAALPLSVSLCLSLSLCISLSVSLSLSLSLSLCVSQVTSEKTPRRCL